MVKLDIHYNGTTWWRLNGQLHRLNGPASTSVWGYYAYWVNNRRHRIDGPAIIIPNGTNQYWVDGKQVSEYEQMFIMETTYD